MYKSATTPKEYFDRHPGRVPGRAVSANSDWKYDVTHGVIVFDDPEHQRLAEYYCMQGEELKNFFDEHPDHHHDAVLRAQRNLLRVLNYTIADELDLLPEEVRYIRDQRTTSTPKPTRRYFESIDYDETCHDSIIYSMIMTRDIDEIWLQVEHDANRTAACPSKAARCTGCQPSSSPTETG